MKKVFKMKTKVWVYQGANAAYHMLYLGKKESDAIKRMQVGRPRIGWGSVPVTATIGKTSWDTSIFPSKDSPYLLLLNAKVRAAESLTEGDTIILTIKIR